MHLEALWNPQRYAQEIAAHPPIGAVTGGLLLLVAFWTVLMGAADTMLRHEPMDPRTERLGYCGAVIGFPLAALSGCLLLSFLTLGIVRWQGGTLSLEALFCLLMIAVAPKWVGWLTIPLREISRNALCLWRALSALLLPYTIWRLWTTLQAADHLQAWQNLLTVAPCLTALVGVSLWEIFAPPTGLRAASPWRRSRGRRAIVYYPPDRSSFEAQAIAQNVDCLIAQIEQLLEVEPLRFRIGVFLCAGPEDLRRINRVKEKLASAYAKPGHIILIYDAWGEIKATVAHELTHTITSQRLHRRMMALLNEGLAEYGADQTMGSARAAISLPLPLATLSHTGIFYDWLYVEQSDHSARAKYAHAGALADYLIGRYGIEKFKALCRQTGYDTGQNQAVQLHQAVRDIYGLSLLQLEQNWRREWIAPGKIEAA